VNRGEWSACSLGRYAVGKTPPVPTVWKENIPDAVAYIIFSKLTFVHERNQAVFFIHNTYTPNKKFINRC